MKKIIIRSLIVLFWVTIIFSGLYLENINIFTKEQQTLNIFAWAGMFDPFYISKFEQEFGVRVNISYYETNEELLVKLKATKGKGYDLIIPSDYTVNTLIKEGMLKPLNKSKLNFWKYLNPVLLNHKYDPNNKYSIPYEWSVVGLGYNKDILKDPPKTWKLIFSPKYLKFPIVMTNDPMWSSAFASYYLYGKANEITIDKLKEITQAFKQQRKHVLAYSDFRADYLLASKDVVAAVISSAYILRSMKKYDHIGFFIPNEGSQVTIENFAIPRETKKDDLIYKFLNFIYKPKSIANNFNNLSFFPPTTNVFNLITAPQNIIDLIKIDKSKFSSLDFFSLSNFKPPVTEQMIQDMWIQIKN